MKTKSLVTIIGAGAAGIGTATALKRLGIEDIQVIDKGEIGQSFLDWNTETRFITPSFNTNGFGFPDYNAITPDTSPGNFIDKEHLSGVDYADYLQQVAEFFQIPVITNETILKIHKKEDGYLLSSEQNDYETNYLIVALGDVAYPDVNKVIGSKHGIFYTNLGDYTHLKDSSVYSIIGGNESGFDAAIQLARRGKRSIIYTHTAGIDSESSDPSQSLSLYTKGRYRKYADLITIHSGVKIKEITPFEQSYYLTTDDGTGFMSEMPPILATGFSNVKSPLIKDFFDVKGNRAVLNEWDESTLSPNLFMVGSQVEHEGVILCFIYKYRQRFAFIANEIASREGISIDEAGLQLYKDYQMFLNDLSCCETDCAC
ncbi:NAD(P)/FAD-dependent oxidoreductase [Marinilactibacillus psychrotolerans]|uniref:Pyridine nucleotide-disulfide oxidoreductase n=1 Tax=Marinilactibacillus psychrotolerans TaxID=191770 RepID=A0A5R9C2D3_9LACT|nr:NAD(P)/FAD-dependent oxidoreductase [Marinilactibacillus psychrotolerans]TLQ06845.1 pyridine nucleotide-disulfide oxidoreductase [Marinilactibacillus psychrotolerans]